MSRPMIVPTVLLLALGAALLTPAEAAPPKHRHPPNLKPLYDKLAKVQGEYQKVQGEKARELSKVQASYTAQSSKHAAPLGKLFAERRKLNDERWKELRKALNTTKAAAIEAKFAPEMDELKKKIANRDAEIGKLVAKRNAEVIKYETEWARAMAEIAAPERKLADLQAQERAELHKLYGAKAKEIRDTFDPKIADLDKKVKAMEQAMGDASNKRKADEAAVWAELHAAIAMLDPPEDRMELRLAMLVEERNVAAALAATQADKDLIWAEYRPMIHALQNQINVLKTDIDWLWAIAREKVSAIEVAYRALIAQLDPPEDGMEAQIAALRADEWAQLSNLGNSAQAQAVRAKYDRLMEPYVKRIQHKEMDVAKHVSKKEAERARIIKQYNAHIARLDPREERLERKLYALQAKEQAELHKAIDVAKAEAINARFASRFADVNKKIAHQQEELAKEAQKHQEAMRKVSARFDGRLAGFQKEANELIRKIQNGGK